MLLILSLVCLSGMKKFDSSLISTSHGVKIHATARAAGRDDGKEALSLTLTNAGEADVMVTFSGKGHVIAAGKTVRVFAATVDDYRERQEKITVHVRERGDWQLACGGLVTVLR